LSPSEDGDSSPNFCLRSKKNNFLDKSYNGDESNKANHPQDLRPWKAVATPNEEMAVETAALESELGTKVQ